MKKCASCIKETLLSMYFDSTHPTRFIMLWAYFVCGLGMVSGSFDTDKDLEVLFSIAPAWFWATLCVTLTASRFIGIFLNNQATYITKRLTPIIGIVFWSAMFAAGVHAEPTGMEMLFVVCAWVEVWILSRAFASTALGEF
jgi:hypothetical protein